MALPDKLKMPDGITLIRRQYLEQRQEHSKADDRRDYKPDVLLKMGQAYIQFANEHIAKLSDTGGGAWLMMPLVPDCWPLSEEEFKPEDNPMFNLEIGAAYIARGLDRWWSYLETKK